jgi:ribosomal protein L11 methyltransferase
MKAGTLWKITISTSREAEDAVAEMTGVFFGEPASIYIDAESLEAQVTVHARRASEVSPRRRAALRAELNRLRDCGLNIAPGRIRVQKIRRQDWAESWKRHFKPIEIGSALLIKPSWSRRKPRQGQAVVVLDPGLSFGTGQHPTTRFCLAQLVAARRPGAAQSFLDIGCGSGILAIAAAKLGYQRVEGFDCDPEAVRIAERNMRQNRLAGKMCLRQVDLIRLPVRTIRRFDVVCANLIFDLLVSARPRVLARVKPGGRLILAGILSSQFSLVRRAYEREGWRLIAQAMENEWKSLALLAPRSLA